jgi:hypothetical protein
MHPKSAPVISRAFKRAFMLAALGTTFGYFIDHNWARENPVRGVEIPSDNDAVRIHVLTPGEGMLYFENPKHFSTLHDLGRLMLIDPCSASQRY